MGYSPIAFQRTLQFCDEMGVGGYFSRPLGMGAGVLRVGMAGVAALVSTVALGVLQFSAADALSRMQLKQFQDFTLRHVVLGLIEVGSLGSKRIPYVRFELDGIGVPGLDLSGIRGGEAVRCPKEASSSGDSWMDRYAESLGEPVALADPTEEGVGFEWRGGRYRRNETWVTEMYREGILWGSQESQYGRLLRSSGEESG